nr:unnamed protein product [Digitaria exilis]
MFAKRLFHKAVQHHHQGGGGPPPAAAGDVPQMNAHVALHYGIPYTASLLAFDPIQRLLAVGTLCSQPFCNCRDGRIKIFGGDNIEGLLISPRSVPYKFLQVWNLEFRQLFYSSQWDVNVTAFAVIEGTFLMYLGDENGLLSVFKYDIDDGKLQRMPYNIPIQFIIETTGVSLQNPQPIVGILIQPDTFGTRVLIAYEKGLLVLWDVSENHAVSVRGYGDLHMKGQITGAQRDAGEAQQSDATDERNMKWPLTGGVPSEMSLNEDHAVERLYIAGYQDGSVRIWDATFPVLMPMFVLDGKVVDVDLDGANASVSSLAFCSVDMTLAVGTASGLVRIYKLREHTGGSSFHFVSESKQEASGEVLATGYQNGQDAAAAAAHAKDKLMQRQEKLERISQQTAELQNGAENFASLAQELAKTMENKKWWKL